MTPGEEPTTMTQVWSEHFTKEGRAYYYNRVTKQSSWEKPADFDSAVADGKAADKAQSNAAGPGAADFEWEELWDPKNERYYYHDRKSRKTQWAKPKNVPIKPCVNGPARKEKVNEKEKASGSEVREDRSHSTTPKTKHNAGAEKSKRESSSHGVEKADRSNRKGSSTPRGGKSRDDSNIRANDTDKKRHKAPDVETSTHENKIQQKGEDNGVQVPSSGAKRSRSPSSNAHVKKRKKKEKEVEKSVKTEEKKRGNIPSEKRMIICDDEERMNEENARKVEEKDTEDGKEATRLLQELSKTDAIMEADVLTVINGFLRAHNASNGPEILVEKLSSGYRGHAQMVGLLASWLDSMPEPKRPREKKALFDVAEGSRTEEKSAMWSCSEKIIYEHLRAQIAQNYNPTLVSNVLNDSTVEPEWLTCMLNDHKWRMMLIELAEQHKTCVLLQYAIRRISEAGHHKEIASITNAAAFYSVFNGILADAFRRIPMASEEDIADDILALKKVCCHSEHSYLYTQELLLALDHKYFEMLEKASENNDAAFCRMVRSKLNRVRYELQEEAITQFGRKVEVFHSLRRRYLCESNPIFADAILSIIREQRCSEWSVEILLKEYRNKQESPPIAHIRDPLILKCLLDPLFNPSENVSTSFLNDCIDLLALAVSTRDERSNLANFKSVHSAADEGIPTEQIERTKEALRQASAICKSDNTLGYNMSSSGVIEKLVSAMEVPVVSMGVVHWLKVMLTSPSFFNNTLLHICFPSLLRILEASIKLHVAQWPVAFNALVIALRLHPDVNPVKALELKRETLRSMVFMITCGYVFPVLDFIFHNIPELDQALLRNFITVLFSHIQAPYSIKFLNAISRILTHPKVQNATKTCPADAKQKLRSFVSYCKKHTNELSVEVVQSLHELLEFTT